MQRKQFLGRLYCRRRGGADVDFKAFNGRVFGFVEIEKPAGAASETHSQHTQVYCVYKVFGFKRFAPESSSKTARQQEKKRQKK